MKLNLGSTGSIKDVALAHGEKLGIALVGVFVVMLIYQAYQAAFVERVPKTASDELASNVRRAKEHIAATTPDPNAIEVPDYPPITEISRENWGTTIPFNPPIWPPETKRDDPIIYAVEKLEVTADAGPLAMVDPTARNPVAGADLEKTRKELLEAKDGKSRRQAGAQMIHGVEVTENDNLVGKSWVVVCGLVPIKKQVAEYGRVFQTVEFTTGSEYPDYYLYIVQRADVTNGGEPNWEKLKVVRQDVLISEAAEFARVPEELEVADPRYLDEQLLTAPLPPLVGRNPGPEVKHSEVPRAPTPEEWERMQMEAQQAQEEPVEGSTEDSPFGLPTESAIPGGEGMMNGRRSMAPPRGAFGPGARRPAPRSRGGMMDEEGGMGMRPRGGMGMGGGRNFGRALGGRGGNFMGGPRGGMAGYSGGLEDVDYRMFRFFDYAAEPGHVYQYRVRLVLLDPNYGVQPRFLTKSAAERISKLDPKYRPYRLSEWSEPSPPIAVPHGGRLIAGAAEATAGQRFDDEPKVNVVAMRFDAAEGANAAAELKELVRGSVANITKKLEILELRRHELVEKEDYHLNTDTTILDIRGGEKLAGGGKNELTAPAEILVMSQTGQLTVQSELSDEEAYQQFQDIFAPPLEGDEEFGPGRRPTEPGRTRGRGGPSVFEQR